MSEPIFKRMQRVVSAGLESATGAVERLNSSGMMRSAVREVEQAIDKLQKRQDAAKERSVQSGFQQAALRDQANELARDARYALDKGREDLGRAAVVRQMDLEDERKRLAAEQAAADDEAKQLQTSIDELKARHADMVREQKAVDAARPSATAPAYDDRKVQRAEAAFERAVQASGVSPGLVEAASNPDVQEIRAARRDEEIEARLAALKAGASDSGAKRGRKTV